MYITITDTYEMTINSTSLSTSLPQDDQGANNGLTNVIIIVIIVMILEIIIIISCLVIFCICFIKRKKKSADTSYYGKSMSLLHVCSSI